MNAFRTLPVLLLALLLAACAPGAGGPTARGEYRPGATYAAPAGGTLYLTRELTPAEAGLSRAAIERAGLNWIPLGIRGQSANAAHLVDLVALEAAEGWEARLWQARLVRERAPGDGATRYRLETELRIDVPLEARELTRRVRGELRFEGGATLPIDLLVRAE